jgi:hypothetical protein
MNAKAPLSPRRLAVGAVIGALAFTGLGLQRADAAGGFSLFGRTHHGFQFLLDHPVAPPTEPSTTEPSTSEPATTEAPAPDPTTEAPKPTEPPTTEPHEAPTTTAPKPRTDEPKIPATFTMHCEKVADGDHQVVHCTWTGTAPDGAHKFLLGRSDGGPAGRIVWSSEDLTTTLGWDSSPLDHPAAYILFVLGGDGKYLAHSNLVPVG